MGEIKKETKLNNLILIKKKEINPLDLPSIATAVVSGPTKCSYHNWDEFAEREISYQVCHLGHDPLALVDVFSDFFFPS